MTVPAAPDLPAARRALTTDGVAILRGLLTEGDRDALAAELDHTFLDAFADPAHRNSGIAGNRFRYVPMTGEHTPVSLALVLRLMPIAGRLLDGPVLPGRAKGTIYEGDTAWHRDADGGARSIAFLVYLDARPGAQGALEVEIGSHRPDAVASAPRTLDAGARDVIVLDERTRHASTGGPRRRQWRLDAVLDDGDDDALAAYFAASFAPGWDGGYDVDRYPSYGPHWRRLDDRWDRRLAALGAYAAAAAEEDAVRRARRSAPPG